MKCRRSYINISTYDQAQILGNITQEGIVASILKEFEEQNIFHIDGSFPEGLAFPLSLLADDNEYMNGSGKKIVPKQRTKFIMEAERLEDICPTFVSRSVIIRVRGEEESLASLSLEKRLKECLEENRDNIRRMYSLLDKNIEMKEKSSVDTLLYRSKQVKVNEMMDIFQSINTTSTNPLELDNYFVYSYFWAASSCLSQLEKLELMSRMKEIIEGNKESFPNCTIHSSNLTALVPMKNPISDKTVSWASHSQSQTLVKLSMALLKNSVPVLVVGENFAQDIFEEIKSTVVNTVRSTKLYSYSLHPLSTAERIVSDLTEKMQARGKSTLVPRESREILVAISDLSTSTNQSFNLVSSLVKDLNEPKKLFVKTNGFNVKDLNLICKLSNKDKTFKESRILRKFVSLYAEDNFEENIERDMAKLIEKNGEDFQDVVGKIGKASIHLMERFQPTVLPSDIPLSEIILKVMDYLLLQKFENSKILLNEFCVKVHQSLISPLLVLSQQAEMESWITNTLKQSQIDFQFDFDTPLTEDHFPSDITPTAEQFRQCREVIHFLNNNEKFISLYGKYGYGKTIVLNVAAEYAGFQVEEIRSLEDLRTGLSQYTSTTVLMVRDTYIETDNLFHWLESLMTFDIKQKVVFLMSPKTDSLVPWRKWIMSNTQVPFVTLYVNYVMCSCPSGCGNPVLEPRVRRGGSCQNSLLG